MGYKIYYGTSPSTYTKFVDIPIANLSNPDLPSYTINNLSPGNYYFAVRAYDVSRTEGSFSSEVSKVIN